MSQLYKKLFLMVSIFACSGVYASEPAARTKTLSRIYFGRFEGKDGFGVEHQGKFIGYAPANDNTDSTAMLQAVAMLQQARTNRQGAAKK